MRDILKWTFFTTLVHFRNTRQKMEPIVEFCWNVSDNHVPGKMRGCTSNLVFLLWKSVGMFSTFTKWSFILDNKLINLVNFKIV